MGLRLLAERTGLTGELSAAMVRRSFVPVHDRGQVLSDVAVMLADVERRSPTSTCCATRAACSGRVASPPTVWRALDEVTPARARKIGAARARVRRHVWSLIPGGVPASKVAGTDLGATVVLDVDATIVLAHSEKEQAAPTFSGPSRSTPSVSGATTRVSSWPLRCVPVALGRTLPPITSRSSLRRSPRSPPSTARTC